MTDRHAAAGRCLSSSLELAYAAHRRGIPVTLVRWKVRDDAEFVDHWAVRLDSRCVIDATRLQIDRSTRLVVDADDYPTNFVDRRLYPASLFIAEYAVHRSSARSKLPATFMLAMARAMFRHDVMIALTASFPVRVVALVADLGKAHVNVLQAAMTRHFEARRDRLVRRLG